MRIMPMFAFIDIRSMTTRSLPQEYNQYSGFTDVCQRKLA